MSDAKKPTPDKPPTGESLVLSRRSLFAGAAAVLGGAVAAGILPAPKPIRRPKWIGHC